MAKNAVVIRTWVDLLELDFIIPKGAYVECPFCDSKTLHKAHDLQTVNRILRDGCDQCEPQEVLSHVGINAKGHLEMFLKAQQRGQAAD